MVVPILRWYINNRWLLIKSLSESITNLNFDGKVSLLTLNHFYAN